MPDVTTPRRSPFFNNIYRIAILLACLLVFGSAAAAWSADLELNVSQQAVQNFFDAALPYHLNYQPLPGAMAADIVISDPRVIMKPGRPGHVFVEVKYRGASPLLGIEPFSGRSRPEVLFIFDPKRQALRLQLSDVRIQAGEKLKFNLDGLIEPMYLPLAPDKPVELSQDRLVVRPKRVRTEVTPKGLRLSLDYVFERRRAPRQPSNP